MTALTVAILAIGLVPPVISIVTGLLARRSLWTIAKDAIRQAGYFLCILALVLPAGIGSYVVVAIAVLILIWGAWHNLKAAAEQRVAADGASPRR
jgi:hypothetical protein